MEMTIDQSLAFARDFQMALGNLAQSVDIVVCPSYASLYALSQALEGSAIHLGCQDLSVASGGAYTGQISGALLADAGCR